MTRFAVRITPDDVGARVTVRTRLAGDPSGATATDTLGYLRSWDGGILVVERRDGSMARLDEADLVAAKTIPPPPPRRPPRP